MTSVMFEYEWICVIMRGFLGKQSCLKLLSDTYACYRLFWQVLEQVQWQLHSTRVAGMGWPYHELSLLQLFNKPEWKEDQTWRRLSQGECISGDGSLFICIQARHG
jgi:hypothetical protein